MDYLNSNSQCGKILTTESRGYFLGLNDEEWAKLHMQVALHGNVGSPELKRVFDRVATILLKREVMSVYVTMRTKYILAHRCDHRPLVDIFKESISPITSSGNPRFSVCDLYSYPIIVMVDPNDGDDLAHHDAFRNNSFLYPKLNSDDRRVSLAEFYKDHNTARLTSSSDICHSTTILNSSKNGD